MLLMKEEVISYEQAIVSSTLGVRYGTLYFFIVD